MPATAPPNSSAAPDAAVREAMDCLEWGRHDEAILISEGLLRDDPQHAEALYLLGLVSFDLDDPMRAIALLEKAFAANPDFYEAAEALAAINAKLGRRQESLYYAKLGAILAPHPTIEGLLPERLGSFFQNLDRGRPDLYLVRAQRRFARGDFDAVIGDCETQLQLTPADPDCLRLLARACRLTGCCERAIAAGHGILHSAVAEAADISELALALDAAGRHEEADACHYAAMERDPADPLLASRRLEQLCRRPETSAAHLARAHDEWRCRHAAQVSPQPLAPRELWDGARPLRVAYLCGSFRDSDLMKLFEPVLHGHDRKRVAVYCYADGGRADAVTERLMRAADKWTDIERIDDETVWQILQGDRIDLAVDLTGHGRAGRPLVFARRPASINVSWLGYPHPPAVGTFDYFLADSFACPETAATPRSAMGIWRLPAALVAYRPLANLPEPGPLPARENGYPTFGLQIDPGHFSVRSAARCAAVLHGLPDARLLLCSRHPQDGAGLARWLDAISHLGLRQRCDVIDRSQNFTSEFDFYRYVDLALDTGTPDTMIETCRALWMGVPMLTLAGERCGTRLAASLVNAAGHAEWIGDGTDDLRAIALRLLSDLDALAALRAGLRASAAASPLGDLPGFVRSLEDAYLAMMRKARR